MASTQNRNTSSDYCLQQRDFRGIFNHVTYVNAQNGRAYVDALPELGYRPTYMSRESFSKNSVDIESALFGINSTNLVNPAPCFVPEITKLDSTNIYEKSPVFLPEPLVIEKNQRPFPTPN